MERVAVATRLTPAEGRRFGFAVGTAFLALAALLWWRGRHAGATAAAVLGGSLILAAATVPGWLGPVYRAWMGLAAVMSRFTAPIFLGAVYFLLLMPTGLILRLLGRDPLAAAPGDSQWRPRSDARERRSDLTRQF